jgi:hypothetical protein
LKDPQQDSATQEHIVTKFPQSLIPLLHELKIFLRQPIKEIRSAPDWSWQQILIVHAFVTALTGFCSGLANRSLHSSIFGLFIMPFLTAVMITISTLFFYYVFQIFGDRVIHFRKLFTVVLLANIPFFIFQIMSGLFPPITLFGLGFSALLLIVGLIDNFQLPRKFVMKLIAGIYILFFIIYASSRINDLEWGKRSNSLNAPEVKLGE